MSDPHAGGSGPKVTPGTLFAYLAGGGLGIYLFLLFLGLGIMAFGAAKRQYPEVVLGMMMIAGAVVAIVLSRDKGGGGGDHH